MVAITVRVWASVNASALISFMWTRWILHLLLWHLLCSTTCSGKLSVLNYWVHERSLYFLSIHFEIHPLTWRKPTMYWVVHRSGLNDAAPLTLCFFLLSFHRLCDAPFFSGHKRSVPISLPYQWPSWMPPRCVQIHHCCILFCNIVYFADMRCTVRYTLQIKIFSQTAWRIANFLVIWENKTSFYDYHHHQQQCYNYIETFHANNHHFYRKFQRPRVKRNYW